MLREHFQHDVLKNQNPWAESGQAERLLQLLPDKVLNEALRKKWEAAPGRSSERKWADIDTLASAGVSKALEAKSAREGLLEAKQDIVLEYTYPRLDVEVSKKQIHLLKSPFVVHPGTGRVCVPIDTERLSDFDPLSVPIVTELLDEIDGFNERTRYETEDHKLQDYEKTRLKPYVDHFRKHVLALLKDERGAKRQREEDITMEF
ncbi:p48 polypeptide of DNA primase [Lecanora helva]